MLSPSNSEYVYNFAHEPKRLVNFYGAGHNLDEAADDVYNLVCDWLLGKLA